MSNYVKAPDSYFTGTSGEDIIKAIFKQWKIACTPLEKSDFGEDILCDIFAFSESEKTNVRTNLSFRAQVKTSLQFSEDGYIRKTEEGFSISISTALLKLWQKSFYPVVVVIWELSTGEGYWCVPLEQFQNNSIPSQETCTLHFSFSSSFLTGKEKIQRYVEEYYNSIFKLTSCAN